MQVPLSATAKIPFIQPASKLNDDDLMKAPQVMGLENDNLGEPAVFAESPEIVFVETPPLVFAAEAPEIVFVQTPPLIFAAEPVVSLHID